MAGSDDRVLLIYDESFRPFLDAVVAYLIESGLRATFCEIPKAYQSALIEWRGRGTLEPELPAALAAAIGDSTILLNCLDGDLLTGPLRGAIIEHPRPRECRLAHIPGFSTLIMDVLTRSPIREIIRDCEQIAWALGESKHATLVSHDNEGNKHELRLVLGGWENEPLMSPGIIYPGSWGNIPPGEAFCCPDMGSATGQIYIDGSVPGSRLDPSTGVLLTFESGRLVHWAPEDSVAGSFITKVSESAKYKGDHNWSRLAELGIGLNPAVAELTGNSLLDEKARGTVHIALGDNTVFGHHIKASIHADLVVMRPSLVLDNMTIVSNGEIQLNALTDWRSRVVSPRNTLSSNSRFFFNESRVEVRTERAYRRLSSAGRIGFVQLSGSQATGADIIAVLTAAIKLNEASGFVSLGLLRSQFPTDVLGHVLDTLLHYRILERNS